MAAPCELIDGDDDSIVRQSENEDLSYVLTLGTGSGLGDVLVPIVYQYDNMV